MRVWTGIAMALLAAAPVAAQEAAPQPAEEPLSLAVFAEKVAAHYPRLRKQHALREEAGAGKALAQSALWPQLRAETGLTATDDPVSVFGFLLKQEAFTQDHFALDHLNHPGTFTNTDAALHVEMPLFNAFQTSARVRSASRQLRAAQEQEAFVAQESRLAAIEGYLLALTQQDMLVFAQEAERAVDQDLAQAEELTGQGVVLGADFYAAKVASGGIRQLRGDFEAQRAAANALLNVLSGEPVGTAHRLTDKPAVAGGELSPLDSWLAAAEANRPDAVAMRAAVSAQQSELFRERASRLPRVLAFGRLETDSHGFSDTGNSYLVGVKGTMDLLDPGWRGRTRQARARLEAVRADESALQDAIRRDVSQAHAQLLAVREQLPIAAQAEADAEQAVELTGQLYKEGRKSIADLVQMRQARLQAAISLRRLKTEQVRLEARLRFLSGKLDDLPRSAEGSSAAAGR